LTKKIRLYLFRGFTLAFNPDVIEVKIAGDRAVQQGKSHQPVIRAIDVKAVSNEAS
jgi:hypothetical protein